MRRCRRRGRGGGGVRLKAVPATLSHRPPCHWCDPSSLGMGRAPPPSPSESGPRRPTSEVAGLLARAAIAIATSVTAAVAVDRGRPSHRRGALGGCQHAAVVVSVVAAVAAGCGSQEGQPPVRPRRRRPPLVARAAAASTGLAADASRKPPLRGSSGEAWARGGGNSRGRCPKGRSGPKPAKRPRQPPPQGVRPLPIRKP